MKNDVLNLVIGISKINTIITIGVIVILMIFRKNNLVFPFVVGSIVSMLSFVLQALTTSILISKNKFVFLISVTSFARIILVALISILFVYNLPSLILYILGIILQQISIISYKIKPVKLNKK
ncbi:MAG: hypothetical protein ACRC7R_04795 [Sarcina sp.]